MVTHTGELHGTVPDGGSGTVVTHTDELHGTVPDRGSGAMVTHTGEHGTVPDDTGLRQPTLTNTEQCITHILTYTRRQYLAERVPNGTVPDVMEL